MSLIYNFIVFQVGWFACVYGVANDQAFSGAAIALTIILFHLCMHPNYLSELVLIKAAVIVGLIWETWVLNFDVLYYISHNKEAFWPPYWLIVMWGLFATTINVSMNWLKDRPALSALMGAIFGPLSFFAGEKIGAVVFLDSQKTILILAFGWSVLLPLLLWLAQRINRLTFLGAER